MKRMFAALTTIAAISLTLSAGAAAQNGSESPNIDGDDGCDKSPYSWWPRSRPAISPKPKPNK